MTLPANWSTVTVTGTYLNIDGEPLKGTVAFSTTTRVVDAAANVTVPPSVRRVSLDNDGKFSVVLPATDDPDAAPTGFTYRVDEDLILPTGARSLTDYLIQLPAATPTVDLAELVPVTPVGEVSPYLQRAANLSDLASAATARTNLGLGAARRSSLLTPVRPSATMITAFQAGHGWTAAGAGSSDLNDTTDVVLGTQSAKFVTNTAAGNATFDSPTLTALNLTGLMPRLLIKVEGQANQASLRFFAGDSTFTNYRNWNLGAPETRPEATFIKEGEWTWVTFNWTHAAVTGVDPRAAVTRFRLSATSTAGTALTVHVGAVTFVPEQPRWPNGVVSVCFDDGRASPFVNAKPKLDALGWAASEYPIIDRVGGGVYATLAQLQQARYYSGWEMGVHASTAARHDAGLTALTTAQLEDELALCQDWLVANGLGNGEGIAWPLGASSKSHEDAAAKLCGYGRGNVSTTRETWPPPLPMRIRSVAVSPSNSLAVIQGYVDEAKNNKAWLCLTFHEITTPGTAALEWPTASFNSLMDYIKTAGCAVLPVAHVLRNAGTVA